VAPQKQNRDYYEREDVDTTIPKGPKQMDWENQRRRDSTSSPIQQQYSLGYIDQLIALKNRVELEGTLYKDTCHRYVFFFLHRIYLKLVT
jgi:hypothetical protein